MPEPEITFVRSEDLLDETPARRVGRALGLSRSRQLAGLALAVVSLPLLTLLLQAVDDGLSLDGEVLLYMLLVVTISLVGGAIVGVGSAAVAAILINWFFVPPVHTLEVSDADQVVSLVVFVVVAALVSGMLEFAVRRSRATARAQQEAETLSRLAGPEIDREDSLHDVLAQARETLGLQSITLKARVRGSGEWVDAEHVGWAPDGTADAVRFDLPASPTLRLVGRGPELFAADQRVLGAFVAAARTAYEGQQLSGRAEVADELETVDRQRTALLAAVGHDLRTPLATTKAAVSTLRQSDIEWSEDERRELLETIEESTDSLDAIVENLLDASRLQTGELGIHAEAIALDGAVSEAVLAMPSGAGRVEIEVPEDLPPVAADAGLLQRVLVNLLDNAVRHGGGSGPIEVTAGAGTSSVKLEVVDHGVGVKTEDREDLFRAFGGGGERGPGGVGLGLWVTKGFVEAMGGAIVADSTPGGGLTIRLRLPRP